MPGKTPEPQKPGLSWSQAPVQATAPAPSSAQTVTQKPASAPAAASNTKTARGKAGWIILGVLVVALVAWGYTSFNKKGEEAAEAPGASLGSTTATTSQAPSTATSAGAVSMGLNGSITVPTPQNAGMEVAISNVSVSQPSWVVVYESNNGKPGNALGAAYFSSGRTSGTVELLRATLPGQKYLVGESLDDGNHIFSLQKDSPVKDANGTPVWVTFETR